MTIKVTVMSRSSRGSTVEMLRLGTADTKNLVVMTESMATTSGWYVKIGVLAFWMLVLKSQLLLLTPVKSIRSILSWLM